MITKQFTLYLENRAGELSNVIQKVADGKVNIDGISVAATTDVGLVQLVTSDAEKTERILIREGVAFSSQDVCVVLMDDEPGSLSNVVAAMANAKINLNYVYATGSEHSKSGRSKVVISAPNLKKVEDTWKKAQKSRK